LENDSHVVTFAKMAKEMNLGKSVALLLSGLMLMFLIAPIIGLFASVNFPTLHETIKDNQVADSIGLTLSTAAITTLIFSILAIPTAYFLARKKFIGKNFLLGMINIPIVIPHSAAGIALLGIISRQTMVGQFAQKIGIPLLDSPIAIGLAMSFVSVPYLINTAREGFAGIPVRYEQQAKLMGASSTDVFFRISLPLNWRYILNGIIQMFARGMSEFGAVVIVSYHPTTTPVLIYERFTSYGLTYAQPIAVIFITICLIVFVLLRKIAQNSYANS